MNTTKKSISGVRTACTLNSRKDVLIHQKHTLTLFITPLSSSQNIFHAAPGLCAQDFRTQFASGFLQQGLTAQT